MCGVHALSADNLIALYTAFTLDYEHRLATFGIDILPKDTTPSETYALFAGKFAQLGSITFEFPSQKINRNVFFPFLVQQFMQCMIWH